MIHVKTADCVRPQPQRPRLPPQRRRALVPQDASPRRAAPLYVAPSRALRAYVTPVRADVTPFGPYVTTVRAHVTARVWHERRRGAARGNGGGGGGA